MILKPAPVSTRQFHYDAVSRTFTADMSETHGFGRVYDDACDDGLTLVSERTGHEVVFVVTDVVRDSEGDVRYWTLISQTTGLNYHMRIWND